MKIELGKPKLNGNKFWLMSTIIGVLGACVSRGWLTMDQLQGFDWVLGSAWFMAIVHKFQKALTGKK